ncbi:MAG: 2-oxoacid:ferredoxin oxidoreductase subunit beta [Chloroflexi bacterium]|nr:2-oxoacid:ferredoxin oxidoreductase subunit beta [Chloroflexota bacterium]
MIETEVATTLTVKDYRSGGKPIWCPGCGDFGVLSATYKALTSLQLPPHQVVMVSGIGCSSRLPYFVRSYGMHTLHGRTLPVATGVKLANPKLTVFAMGGDGDFFAIGAGHLPHACARNVDITAVCMDNSIYGLTKGQTSPTSPIGHKTKTTPYGSIVQPMNPIQMALTFGATFVARGYSAKPNHLTDIIVRAIQHRGFSFIQVDSPCTEFNNTYNYYDSLVEELPEDWDSSDLTKAINLALTEERVHIGVFYQAEQPSYAEKMALGQPESFDIKQYLQRFA